jgi:hypothetical protein
MKLTRRESELSNGLEIVFQLDPISGSSGFTNHQIWTAVSKILYLTSCFSEIVYESTAEATQFV